MSASWRGVVWLDRDGTLLDDPGYLRDPAGVRLLSGAAEAVGELNRLGVGVVLVTNQSGIDRGLMSRADVEAVHAELGRQLAGHGSRLDAIYFCPHRPAEALEPGERRCSCRKPAPGLVLQARRELELDAALPQVCVGDKESDLELGRALGCPAVLVETGEGRATRRRLESEGRLDRTADHVAADLAAALPFLALTLLGETRP